MGGVVLGWGNVQAMGLCDTGEALLYFCDTSNTADSLALVPLNDPDSATPFAPGNGALSAPPTPSASVKPKGDPSMTSPSMRAPGLPATGGGQRS